VRAIARTECMHLSAYRLSVPKSDIEEEFLAYKPKSYNS